MQITIDVPETFFKEVSFGYADPEKEIKFLLAAKLTEAGRISTGRAAEWLGMSKPRFLVEMSRYGLSAFPIDEASIEEDMLNASNGDS